VGGGHDDVSAMTRSTMLALLVVVAVASARAQAPTGIIAGIASDSFGAAVGGARVDIVNRETGYQRVVMTSSDGRYAAEALLPGEYRVTVEFAGFKRIERLALVEAGASTTVDLSLEIGEVTETVIVPGATPLLRRDHHQVGGLVGRAQIENLPLNGRNFLELAKLEPGVTNPVRLNDNRTFVSLLGAGLQTIPRVGYSRVTIDGANVVTPGTAGVLFQVSQDIVQEFQISTANLDMATGLATNGAINIVTRSGTNDYRGGGFIVHRDHHLAAYPGLQRDPANPQPSFRREQFGFQIGGPIRTDHLFFLASYERHDQRGVVTVQPLTTEFATLGGIFSSPYTGDLFSVRADARIHSNHGAFVRYTHDGNGAFAPSGNAVLPSAWSQRTNQVDQGLAALTSVLSGRAVNDFRFSSLSFTTNSDPARAKDCPGCIGLGAPFISIPDAGLTLGSADAFSFGGRRYQLTDSIVWQQTNHRLRFGFDWEHVTSTVSDSPQPPARMTLWSPSQIRQLDPTIPLPASFATLEDILQLPVQTVENRVGSFAVPWQDFSSRRVIDLYRVSVSDTWQVSPRLTVNGGLAWSYEPNALNHDLTKPALLIPLLGPDRLNPPDAQIDTFAPTLGLAWMVTQDARTVVRAGVGRYFDPAVSTNSNNLNTERHYLSPLGIGRISIPPSRLGLEFLDRPTAFTGAQFVAMLTALRADLLRTRNPDNRDFSVRNIDLEKRGQNLYDPSYQMPYAVHVGAGVERELTKDVVVSADIIWKRFVHTFINGIDYNRWNSVTGPVIPRCLGTQGSDVAAMCSNGNFFFDTTIGRARYTGLLVRAEKRFSGRTQFLASYALASYVGTNGTGTGTSEASGGRVFGFNNDDWFENYGPLPTDYRHVLNLSGFVDLPWRFQVGFSVAAYSRPPFSAYVGNVDFNGDGTRNDLLPGTTVNQFGRERDEADLEELVALYNQKIAGTLTAGGQTAPFLTLPDRFTFDDSFFTQDVRLTRTFPLGGDGARLLLMAEVFNLFNTANLIPLNNSGNLANSKTFGQPGSRFSQVFGSGGPRALQLGARISF
jgi:hypothetical protein